MLDFTKLGDMDYLFGPGSSVFSRSDHLFFWLAAVFVVAGVAAKIWAVSRGQQSPDRYILNRLFHAFLTMGLLMLLWVGARSENIPWLATHFVALLLLLIWLVWLGFIARYFIRKFRADQATWQAQQIKEKYLKK